MMGLNPRDMQKAMKRMGIKQDEIDAQEVVIRCSDKDIIISSPQVIKVNMMGNEIFQVSGAFKEQSRIPPSAVATEILEEDIATVIAQTQCSRADAERALTKANGNIAQAIMILSE